MNNAISAGDIIINRGVIDLAYARAIPQKIATDENKTVDVLDAKPPTSL